MRTDQYLKLQDLAERLGDVVLTDADPENWVGNGRQPKDLTKDERGDAYWCRKMAVASLSVMMRVSRLVDVIQEQSNAGSGAAEVKEGETLLDAEIASAENEANRLLDKLHKRQKKSEFDKRVHGKS